jgi:hypothetical protein
MLTGQVKRVCLTFEFLLLNVAGGEPIVFLDVFSYLIAQVAHDEDHLLWLEDLKSVQNMVQKRLAR